MTADSNPTPHLHKSFFKSDLFLPGLLLAVYIVFLIVARGVVPTADELINSFADLYAKYGYQIIFAASLLEAAILVNFFVPGQIAMAMGAIFASTGQVELTKVIVMASLGAIIGYILDYILGYFGFGDILKKSGHNHFVEVAKKQLQKFGTRGLIIGLIHPTSGSFLSFAAGVINMSFTQFLLTTVVSTFFWLTLWGILFYIIGDTLLQIIIRYSFLILILVVTGLFIASFWKGKDVRR